MSTATTIERTTTEPVRSSGSRQPLAGLGTLVRFNLRRDRVRIPIWTAALAAVQVGGAASYPDLYPTAADRQSQADIMASSPAMKALTGPGHGLDDYTFGAMMSNEYLGFMLIFVGLMSVLLFVRYTRAEEETGRAELIRASVVGRHAHLTAAFVTVTIANAALGLLIAIGMGGLGIESIDWPGSLLFGAAFASVGLVFAAIAAVTVQITEYGRAASGIAGATIGLAYLFRAIGDIGSGELSWLSPIGWAQATAPYVENIWWPLGLALAVTAGLLATAYALSRRRDLGAGLRAQRPGAPRASASLGTPLGFAWRLQRSGVLWWGIGLTLFGLGYGSAVDIIEDYADNEVIQDMVESVGGTSLTESWLSIVIALVAIICTIFAILAAMRLRREETSGRAESVLSTALSRTRWVGTHAAIALVGGLAMLLISGLALALTVSVFSEDELFWPVLGAVLAYAPALWLAAGLVVAMFGLVPRAIGLAWAVIAYAVLVVYLGGLLQLPDWMLNLSPFNHVPRMPAADFDVVPLVILTVLAASLITAGLAGFRRRDLTTR